MQENPPPTPPAGPSWRKFGLVSGIGLGLCAYAWLIDPGNGAGYVNCQFHQLTGLLCPGCGGQRALYALVHGHWGEALRSNAFAVALLLPAGLTAYVWYGLSCLGLAPPPRPPRFGALWAGGAAAFLVAFAVLRNLPLWPFSLLAP